MANRSNGVSVLDRAVKILESFTIEAPTLTLTAISVRAGVPLSSTQRLVVELERHGLLERLSDKTYRVGNHLWELGTRTPGALGLREIALPYLHAVQSQVHQHVQLVVRSDLDALIIERISARDAVVSASVIGGRIPLQHSSAGVVLLAAAEDSVTDQVIERGLNPLTDTAISTGDELRRQVALARRNGYGVSRGWIFLGSRGVAVPIVDGQSQQIAALGIVEANDDSSPDSRVRLLRAAANGITEALIRSTLPPDHPHAMPGGVYRRMVQSSQTSMEFLEHLPQGL